MDVDHSQLVVIDTQTRLTQAMHNRDMLLRNCGILTTAAQTLNIPITVTEQYPKGLGDTELVLREIVTGTGNYIEKTCFSCFGSTEFANRVTSQDRSQVILCGIEAHVCVLQTAMDLLAQNLQVFIAADAVDSRADYNKQNGLQRLTQAGAVVTVTESVLFEWLRDAKHEQFKALTALIR